MSKISAPVLLHWEARGEFTKILDRSGFSLVLSTRPDSVIFVGAYGGHQSVNVVPVPRVMGLAVEAGRLAVGSDRGVVVYINTPELAPQYPAAPKVYDAFYAARTIHLSGPCDLHDLAFRGNSVVAANTRFSCICKIDGSFSFEPIWHPPFISRLCPEDRCHLNGFAMKDEEICYATSLSGTDQRGGWRANPDRSGQLIDVKNDRILRQDLCMPHSPRIVDDRLYVLNGGEGELLEIDRNSGVGRCIARLPGFTHGLAYFDGYLFIGISRNRSSRSINPPPVAQREKHLSAGVVVLDVKSEQVVGSLEFTGGLNEVYDIQVLPGVRRAGMQRIDDSDGLFAISTPSAQFWIDIDD